MGIPGFHGFKHGFKVHNELLLANLMAWHGPVGKDHVEHVLIAIILETFSPQKLRHSHHFSCSACRPLFQGLTHHAISSTVQLRRSLSTSIPERSWTQLQVCNAAMDWWTWTWKALVLTLHCLYSPKGWLVNTNMMHSDGISHAFPWNFHATFLQKRMFFNFTNISVLACSRTVQKFQGP